VKIFFIGDIVGRPGRNIIIENLSTIRKEYGIDVVIANGENASGGVGLVIHNAKALFEAGIDVITSGNHIFQHKDYEELFDEFDMIIRPANYPPGVPGKGVYVLRQEGCPPIAVVNLMGRTFMDPVDCPFQAAERILEELPKDIKITIVDIHAEATSEKIAMGWFLDGRVSAVIGTHTHVQTSDERILLKGTAYITDVGMTGPTNSIIGVEVDLIIKRYLTKLPVKFSVTRGPSQIDAVLIDIDKETGESNDITRMRFKRDVMYVDDQKEENRF